MCRKPETLLRMNERVEELKNGFNEFIEYFDKTSFLSGPSLYFHKKVIEILSENGLEEVLGDNLFFEYFYATLASWGLYRMGKTNTKLVNFEDFKNSILANKNEILQLKDKKITQLNSNATPADNLMKLIKKLEIGEGETKIIFNSKTLHHLLPNLMPPIDRQHTLLFFYIIFL